MVVFVYSADSMVECVYCHLCVWVDWVVESVQLAGPVACMIYLISGKFGEGGNWTIIIGDVQFNDQAACQYLSHT